ncbi:uncharacterized protein LOC117188883 [Drosophila miranda]|uniref:uncharacterized protein LOC117188883 n=1 Tax=Drosophila miranda TaxID=7229 RepID=UPI00143FAE34|nr:uncharacterized protein LOC117188883 [Drosophila miranda]
MACTSESSINMPLPAKRRRTAAVKRRPKTSSDSNDYSIQSIHRTPNRTGGGRPKKDVKKALPKRKTSVNKRLPSKSAGAPCRTKKVPSTSSKSKPKQPTNRPSKSCKPKSNQSGKETMPKPGKTEISNDKAGAQKAAKTAPAKKFRFWPWSQQESTQNNDMLSDEPVATVLMDGAHLSEEKPMTENYMPEMTGEKAAMKLDVMSPEKPDLMHPEMTGDEETEALPVDNKN